MALPDEGDIRQTCLNCQRVNAATDRFCAGCGHPLRVDCTACGFANLPGQQFCGACGRELGLAPDKPKGLAPTNGLAPDKEPTMAGLTLPPAGEPMPGSPQRPLRTEDLPTAQAAHEAVVALELVNLPDLQRRMPPEALADLIDTSLLAALRTEARHWNGQPDARFHKNSFFIRFRDFSAPAEAIHAALRFACAWLGRGFEIPVPDGPPQALAIRMGVDTCEPGDPLAALTERTIARPNTVVVSERAFLKVAHQPDLQGFHAIGPIQQGQKMVRLYQWSPESRPQAPDELHFAPAPDAAIKPEPTTPSTETMYEPPVYGSHRAARAPNLSFDHAAIALTQLLDDFINQPDPSVQRQQQRVEAPGQLPAMPGRVVALCAETGSGKTCLIQTARQGIDPESKQTKAFWLMARPDAAYADPDSQIPLYPWLQMLGDFLGIPLEGYPRAEARRQISEFLYYLGDGRLDRELLIFLENLFQLHTPDPLDWRLVARSGEIERQLYVLLTRLARHKPLVLMFDDVDRMDAASLEVLMGLLSRQLLESRVCIVLSQPLDWAAEGALANVLRLVPYKEFSLGSLTDADIERYLHGGPFGEPRQALPPALVSTMGQAGRRRLLGLEEQMRLLFQRGYLISEGQHYAMASADSNGMEAPVAVQLEDAVAERLQGLDDVHRYALQVAATVGERFALPLVMELCQLFGDEFQSVFDGLLRQGWIVADGLHYARFRHGMLWRVVYRNTPDTLRTKLHGLCVAMLDQKRGEDYSVIAGVMALHAERAGDANMAHDQWNLHGLQVARLGALEAANAAFAAALRTVSRLAGQDRTAARLRLFETLGLLNLQRRPELAIRLLEESLARAKVEQDLVRQIELYTRLARAQEAKLAYPMALKATDEALNLLWADRHPEETFTVRTRKLGLLEKMGQLAAASDLYSNELEPMLPVLHEALVQYRPIAHRWAQARLTQLRGAAHQLNRPMPDVLSGYEALIDEARRADWPDISLDARLSRVRTYLWMGHYDALAHDLEHLLPDIEALAEPAWALARWGLVAMAWHIQTGDWNDAALLIPNTSYQAEIANDAHSLIHASMLAGVIQAGLGQPNKAKAMLEEALTHASNAQFASLAFFGWRKLAQVEITLNAKAVGLQICENAMAIHDKPVYGQTRERILTGLTMARCLLATGEATKAGRLLEGLWQQALQSRLSPLVAEAGTHIGMLYETLAQQTGNMVQHERGRDFFRKSEALWRDLGNMYQARRVAELSQQPVFQ